MRTSLKIVLVYLGKKIPDYFWDNVRHLLKIQDKYPIHVIASTSEPRNSVIHDRIKYFKYNPSREIDESLSKLEIDQKFRDGFWRYSLERLFVLTQHHKHIPSERILHLESDILIMPNFPFSNFKNIESIFWSRVDASRDVASIVFLPTNSVSEKLEKSMLEIIKETKSIDDMKIMSKIARDNKVPIDLLPSISSPISSLVNKDIMKAKSDTKLISRNFNVFNGIFDSASIGIWLTGTDPRNYFGVTKRFENSHLIANGVYVNPEFAEYEINELGHIGIRELDSFTPIYNLHIHSKNRKYFQDDYLALLRQDVNLSKQRKMIKTFSFQVLSALVVQNWRQRTLLRFLTWLPLIQKAKKLLRAFSLGQTTDSLL